MAASTLLCLRLVALLALGCTAAVSARTVAPRGAALQDVMVEVSGAAHTASFPRPVAGPIQATAGDKLRVSFKLDGTLRGAHQVFLRLTHQESGEQAFYMFKEAKSSDAVAVSIDLSDDAANMLERRSGDYVAHVLVGDASLEVRLPAVSCAESPRLTRIRTPLRTPQHGLLYELAQVQLQLPPPQRAPEVPLYHRTLLHESDTTLRALPEIQHRFREPERRPPAIVSRAFTAIALVRARAARRSPPRPARLTAVWGNRRRSRCCWWGCCIWV